MPASQPAKPTLPKYFIRTFGCQMNISDSERIATILHKQGFAAAANLGDASLVIFNTCGVRQMAEDRVYGQIHNLKTKGNGRKPTIILTGCLAERKDVQRRLKDKVDLFVSIGEFQVKLSNILLKRPAKAYLKSYLSVSPEYSSPHVAYVPVMTGCNNFCSYCVVPYARGREVSRPAAEVLAEVRKLIKNKYKLIVLVGQNVNSYRDGKTDFPKLLKMVHDLRGDFWLSFLTSHPKDMSETLIQNLTELPKVCEFIHLPIQAGDNEVLKRMNRKYTQAHYLKLIAKIKQSFRKHKPGKLFAIAGDIIVGFPGETRTQFQRSTEVLKKVNYDMIYFGRYSPRPGTLSAQTMKDNVSKPEKVRREKFLNDILEKTAYDNNRKYLNKIIPVLILSEENKYYFGQTRTFKNVRLPKLSDNLVGKIIPTKITAIGAWNLEGSAE